MKGSTSHLSQTSPWVILSRRQTVEQTKINFTWAAPRPGSPRRNTLRLPWILSPQNDTACGGKIHISMQSLYKLQSDPLQTGRGPDKLSQSGCPEIFESQRADYWHKFNCPDNMYLTCQHLTATHLCRPSERAKSKAYSCLVARTCYT